MKNKTARILFLLVVLSFALKLAGINHRIPPEDGDTCIFMSIAKTVFTNKPFYVGVGEFTHPFANTPPFHPDCSYQPLFPVLIAIMYKLVGFGLYYSTYLACLFAALCAIPAYLIGKELFNESAGLFTALYIAIEPVLTRSAVMGLAEPFFLFTALFGIYFILRYFSRDTKTALVAGGIFLGLSYLTKAPGLTLILVAALSLMFKQQTFGKRISSSAIFIVAALIAALPWLVRNFILFKNPTFNATSLVCFMGPGECGYAIPRYELNLINFLKYNSLFEIIGMYANAFRQHISWHSEQLFIFLPIAIFVLITGYNFRRGHLLLWLIICSHFSLVLYGLSAIIRHLLLSFVLLVVFAIGYLKSEVSRINHFLIFYTFLYIIIMHLFGLYQPLYKFTPPFFERHDNAIFMSDIGRWLKDNTEPEAVLISTHPSVLNFWSGRISFICPSKIDTMETAEELEVFEKVAKQYNITYFVDFSKEGKVPKGFRLVHTFAKPLYYTNRIIEGVRVYRRV